ncbi:fibronectin type III domain-containing protein [Hymenobacter sp. ASUV-10]|uniref:Fibronectin type III domain-containing protein n=1 Tax=Hymenobacter aranciens TaxID=3063996 RepID=A0ABT9BC53_9BACT|nr:fibronectin type III domain-containing protein [Hymenobacter sp. ASUV-10]MDO7875842.1 fibronectin type III domain-containing protein [Hymenobacter sp. ASUV-10]
MTNLLLLASLLGSATAAFFNPDEPAVPPVLSVKAARAAGPGATVTLRAVVINGAELGNIRYVQDGEAGLALYALSAKVPGFGELRSGDSIQVTGLLKNYNGLLEMDPVQSVHTLGRSSRLRALQVPAAQAASLMTEANEGRLLEIKGVTKLVSPNGNDAASLSSNSNYLVNGLPGALVRVSNSSTGPDGLVDHALPTGETFDVRGILSQYAPSGSGGYQLLPRVAADIVRGGGLPRLTEEPVPVNVTSSGFTIVFSTLNPGDTRVRYGLNAKELKESRVDAALTTRHSLTLDNLIAGTTYYVEVSSRNAAGTETAPAVPFITASGGKKLRIGTKN